MNTNPLTRTAIEFKAQTPEVQALYKLQAFCNHNWCDTTSQNIEHYSNMVTRYLLISLPPIIDKQFYEGLDEGQKQQYSITAKRGGISTPLTMNQQLNLKAIHPGKWRIENDTVIPMPERFSSAASYPDNWFVKQHTYPCNPDIKPGVYEAEQLGDLQPQGEYPIAQGYDDDYYWKDISCAEYDLLFDDSRRLYLPDLKPVEAPVGQHDREEGESQHFINYVREQRQDFTNSYVGPMGEDWWLALSVHERVNIENLLIAYDQLVERVEQTLYLSNTIKELEERFQERLNILHNNLTASSKSNITLREANAALTSDNQMLRERVEQLENTLTFYNQNYKPV